MISCTPVHKSQKHHAINSFMALFHDLVFFKVIKCQHCVSPPALFAAGQTLHPSPPCQTL